jgi:hypothetical protein
VRCDVSNRACAHAEDGASGASRHGPRDASQFPVPLVTPNRGTFASSSRSRTCGVDAHQLVTVSGTKLRTKNPLSVPETAGIVPYAVLFCGCIHSPEGLIFRGFTWVSQGRTLQAERADKPFFCSWFESRYPSFSRSFQPRFSGAFLV